MADYEINKLAREESWRMFRIIGELVEGFDKLADIEPAVSVYGSARIRPGDEYYSQAVDICRGLGKIGFSIITGGGPGIMEAANRGAKEAGVTSVGLNITLPEEQTGNCYTTKTITFNHFFVRKIMLVKYATAFIIMPGGLGTMDEMTEVLTLIQTKKIRPFPVILYGRKFWQGFLDWLRSSVFSQGFISEEDFDLVRIHDRVEDVIDDVQGWYWKQEIRGKGAISR